jgi:predicted metalloprotease with PDZ domain
MKPLPFDGSGAPGQAATADLPRARPDSPPVPEPEDVPYPGTLRLRVDATDVNRRIFRATETIPVSGPGPMVLLYPKWLPGFHAPQAPVELFAGLKLRAGGEPLEWTRHPVTVNAFLLDVPAGVEEIEAEFQFLSPTDASHGRVLCTPDMLCLPWNAVLLYPAGYYARQITVAASLHLPDAWGFGCVLDGETTGDGIRFAPVPLDVLIDSPVFAGRHHRRFELDGSVHLEVFAEQPHLLDATPEQIAAHRRVVEQADQLFGTRQFDRFRMLLALSDELTSAGVEHHRSFEAVTRSDYFANWDGAMTRRDTVPHEYLHSWNGKHCRGADSWSPCFEKPIRNSLLWVYEGLTQYWTNVLCARAGLWSLEQTLGAIALTAARYDVRPGSQWRPTADTTRDPIIAARAPLPWPSWQRSEDYYAEGALIWLDVDTRIRELTGEARSLDGFARAFFGAPGDGPATRLYSFGDVVSALQAIAPFDWEPFFEQQLRRTHDGAPLAGLERGGYRLAYDAAPNPYARAFDEELGQVDLTHVIGLTASSDGVLSDVLWEGPAFDAGLTIKDRILSVAGRDFSPDQLRRSVAEARGGVLELTVTKSKRVWQAVVTCPTGPRYPRLEPIEGSRRRLDEILRPV